MSNKFTELIGDKTYWDDLEIFFYRGVSFLSGVL